EKFAVNRESLPRRQVDVAQDEQGCEYPEDEADFSKFSGGHFYQSVRDQTKAQPGCNAEGQRRGQDGHERRESFGEVFPVTSRNGVGHQGANKNQGGGGSVAGDGRRQRRAEGSGKE